MCYLWELVGIQSGRVRSCVPCECCCEHSRSINRPGNIRVDRSRLKLSFCQSQAQRGQMYTHGLLGLPQWYPKEEIGLNNSCASSRTYTLVPTPIAGHKVAVRTLPITKISVGNIIQGCAEIWVSENVVDDFSRITVPKSVLFIHPSRRG